MDFIVIDHGIFKNFFVSHSVEYINESDFRNLSQEGMNRAAVIYFELSWSDYNNLKGNLTNLSQYIQDGGVAVINVAGNRGSQNDIDPMGTDYDASHSHNSEQILLGDHPYITGEGYPGAFLTVSQFNNWSSTDHGWLWDLPEEADAVLQDDHGVSWIEYSHGRGTVIVTSLTYGWGSNGGRGDPLRNLIEYALFLVSTTLEN